MNDTSMEDKANSRSEKGNVRIVPLKPGQQGPCVFFVPGTGGRVEGFANLAMLLQTPMPVYAIEARGVDPSSKPDEDIGELVDHYLQQVKKLQPMGPYFLLGHSFGGMVVYEMAQRLIETGTRVACLILLDTFTPKKFWPISFRVARQWARIREHIARVTSTPFKDLAAYYSRRLIARWYGLHQIPQDLKFGRDAARMLLANEMLLKTWRPDFYPGKLTVFCTADTKDLSSIWRHCVGELDHRRAAGGHINLIEPPYVMSLARDISLCLASAPANGHDKPDREIIRRPVAPASQNNRANQN
jgi:thioesterase domain-containing protein